MDGREDTMHNTDASETLTRRESLLRQLMDAKGQSTPAPKYPVGRGWWPILDEYLPRLAALGATLGGRPYEKYGTLRIDLDYPGGDDTEQAVTLEDEMEDISAVTCEDCGQPGFEVTRGGTRSGWVKTLCVDCAKKRGFSKSR